MEKKRECRGSLQKSNLAVDLEELQWGVYESICTFMERNLTKSQFCHKLEALGVPMTAGLLVEYT
jgi:hypothetical protein